MIPVQMGLANFFPSASETSAIRLDIFRSRSRPMKIAINRLLSKHQKIDAQLRAEHARRFPDLMRIHDLKKLKLQIKDRIQGLSLGRLTQTA
jgi:hypothetical protein